MPKKRNIETILVVDDEQEVRDFLREFLEDKGFKVTLAEDGIKARESLASSLPDLVIVDLLLPGEHGMEIVKFIKEKYFLPTLIISGIYKYEEIIDRIKEYFVEGFLEKPVNINLLLEKIEAIANGETV